MKKQKSVKNSLLIRFLKWAYDLTVFKYTLYGVITTSAMTIAALLVIDMPVFLLIVAPLAFIFMSYVIGYFFKPKVRLEGRLPDQVVAGREFIIRYTITNIGRISAWDIGLEIYGLPVSFQRINRHDIVQRLKPGQSIEYLIRILANRRGIYRLREPICYTTFPFNLVRMFRGNPHKLSTVPVVVQPDYYPMERIYISSQLRHQAGGIMQASNVGESPEYIGNREYRHGDSPRRIDPRAWARLAIPVVKEYDEEYFSHLALILDTYFPRNRQDIMGYYPELEAAISLTAAVVDAISRGEDIIDVFATGSELHVFRAGRHLSTFDKVLEILAGVDACHEDPFDQVAPRLAEEIHQTSAVICIFLDWDKSREKIVRFAVESGCTVRVVIVRDKSVSQPFHQVQDWCGEILVYKPQDIIKGNAVRI